MWLVVISRVHQRSVVGLWLFNIYISDLMTEGDSHVMCDLGLWPAHQMVEVQFSRTLMKSCKEKYTWNGIITGIGTSREWLRELQPCCRALTDYNEHQLKYKSMVASHCKKACWATIRRIMDGRSGEIITPVFLVMAKNAQKLQKLHPWGISKLR